MEGEKTEVREAGKYTGQIIMVKGRWNEGQKEEGREKGRPEGT